MLTWIAILVLAALSGLEFLMGRRKALASAGGGFVLGMLAMQIFVRLHHFY